MTTITINGRDYKMTVNLGTLTYAEMLNEGVKPSQTMRLNLGFALACFYGADMNCGLQIEDLIQHCSTAERLKELNDAVKRETDLFNGINDDAQGNADSATATEGAR